MLNISESAMHICSATVQQLSGAQTNSKCLRIIKKDAGVSISFETPRVDDEIVHFRGQSIIAVPDDVAGELAGMTLDVADDGRFVIA